MDDICGRYEQNKNEWLVVGARTVPHPRHV